MASGRLDSPRAAALSTPGPHIQLCQRVQAEAPDCAAGEIGASDPGPATVPK